ncbi:hypothetical protein GBA52_009546 [Prunus armeniaca]|nr:hypothetical protein GBA52_009546 [Prunus armeniaca]
MELESRHGRADRNITFEKITLDAAKNPIIIDQFYCDRDHNCKSQASALSVDYVKYIDFEGTSASEEAIKLDCDQNSGCHNIIMDRIKITSAVPGKKIYASCSNAIGTSLGTTVPNVPCLKSGDKPTTSLPAPPLPATPLPSLPLLVIPQPSPPVPATPPIALILPPPPTLPLPDMPPPAPPSSAISASAFAISSPTGYASTISALAGYASAISTSLSVIRHCSLSL